MLWRIIIGLLAQTAGFVPAANLPPSYETEVRPLLTQYCNGCHSTDMQKGDLDLEQFTTIHEVRKHAKIWEGVLEQMELGEMPPKKEIQPSAPEREKLMRWVRGVLEEIALANAGDPGPVILRRLSNMEYTYTVRDLTGVPTLDPAKEFPVDGAAGEGFTNAGAGLVMSPALLTKYLDAAKEIAGHMVLLQDGIRFSEYTSPSDWTEETLREIRAFYARYTEVEKNDASAGGRLPVEKYLAALVKARDELRKGGTTIPAVAAENGLNARYAAFLWAGLNDAKPSAVMDDVRHAFNEAAPDDPSKLIHVVQEWQQSLWRFASVGHIGKKNGPKGWQEEVSPLGLQHAIRLKLSPPPKDRSEVTVYLVMRDVNGVGHDIVEWEDARIVAKDRKEVMLRDVVGALPAQMTAQTPAVLEVKVPTAMITAETEFAVTAKMAPHCREEACAQVHALTETPEGLSGLMPSHASSGMIKGKWSDNNLRSSYSAPVLVNPTRATGKRLESGFAEFRKLFPMALCYTKIVPVDEIVTLTLFYREDAELKRLMLNDAEIIEIDHLWDQLRFISESPLKQVDVFDQLWQYATQDAKPDAFEPMREPIMRDAAAFKELQLKAGPHQVQAIVDFAAKAWRRPLNSQEEGKLKSLYQTLRTQQGMPHVEAVRMLLARVLTAPAFLYRGEKASPGDKALPVGDWELATRLSYFLWSSTPDAALLELAGQGRLHEPDVLQAQAQRMLRDEKVRRLAVEFGCQWLHVRDVETLDEKSERHFPIFAALRDSMQEEVTLFFVDLFQQDRSVLSLIDADYTFMNGALAAHYGMSAKSPDWQRVDGIRARGRGGILGFAATLAKQSGASRTSPILRGTWLSEVVLGDKLPNPPKGVPVLPDEAPEGLTERQLIERHSSEERCAGCHKRIDPFGFALEGFDAIGRARVQDAAGATINSSAQLPDGTRLDGLDGLRTYLLTTRRDDFLRQFCRKLLGYALGRGVQLSDKPLIDSMMQQLQKRDFRVTAAIEAVILSPQFRQVRGRDYVTHR